MTNLPPPERKIVTNNEVHARLRFAGSVSTAGLQHDMPVLASYWAPF